MLFEIAIPANHSAYDDGLSSLLFRAYFVAYTGLNLLLIYYNQCNKGWDRDVRNCDPSLCGTHMGFSFSLSGHVGIILLTLHYLQKSNECTITQKQERIFVIPVCGIYESKSW